MTGLFTRALRECACVSLNCNAPIKIGDQVYLFKKSERQTICLSCAKARWGYEPNQVASSPVSSSSSRESIGFDSTRTILKKLQQSNQHDPKMRQAGGDR